ncbi:hypothetical protein ACVWY2_002855 [Bradyrhizobium sp. JR6.1]
MAVQRALPSATPITALPTKASGKPAKNGQPELLTSTAQI